MVDARREWKHGTNVGRHALIQRSIHSAFQPLLYGLRRLAAARNGPGHLVLQLWVQGSSVPSLESSIIGGKRRLSLYVKPVASGHGGKGFESSQGEQGRGLLGRTERKELGQLIVQGLQRISKGRSVVVVVAVVVVVVVHLPPQLEQRQILRSATQSLPKATIQMPVPSIVRDGHGEHARGQGQRRFVVRSAVVVVVEDTIHVVVIVLVVIWFHPHDDQFQGPSYQRGVSHVVLKLIPAAPRAKPRIAPGTTHPTVLVHHHHRRSRRPRRRLWNGVGGGFRTMIMIIIRIIIVIIFRNGPQFIGVGQRRTVTGGGRGRRGGCERGKTILTGPHHRRP
mmetsp:Transcript_11832/g.32833  ORF Transcript_11832/g.32833 Transcript_11832/m.32833 type:complete len:337 (-) Transcript_11832:552-1562(-)